MTSSILKDVKKFVGDVFDPDLIIFINAELMTLWQLGIGKANFAVTGEKETWQDFLTDETNIQAIKSCVCLKARVMFDPPQSSYVLNSIKEEIANLEFRLNVQVDPKEQEGES